MTLTKERMFRMDMNRLRFRKRGVSMESVMLGVIVALFMAPQIASLVKGNFDSNQDTISGRQFETMADASRSYLNDRYEVLRRDLINRANDPSFDAGSPLTMVLTPEDLAMNGYLSRGYITATSDPTNYRGQSYRVLLRAVSVTDTGFPQRTLNKGDIVAMGGPVTSTGTNKLNDNLTDAAENNDEMGIESIMVTVGGEPIDTVRAARVIAASESPVATDLRLYDGTLRALGSQGNFELPLDPWMDIADDYNFTLQNGHLLSVVSLTGLGDGRSAGSNMDMRRALLRCHGLEESSEDYSACIQDGNNMWADIVFQDVPDRTRPGIYNLGNISCAPPVEADPANPAPTLPNPAASLTIDCGAVTLSDDVTVGGDLYAESDIYAEGDIYTERDVYVTNDVYANDVNARNNVSSNTMEARDNINLAGSDIGMHMVLGSGVVATGTRIPAPKGENMCPSGRSRVKYGVSGMIENVGRAISGHRPYVDETDRIARIIVFTNEDYCSTMTGNGVAPLGPLVAGSTNAATGFEPGTYSTTSGVDGAGNPITVYPNADYTGVPRACLIGGLNSPVTGTRADGFPDAYWVGVGQGLVSYEYVCDEL